MSRGYVPDKSSKLVHAGDSHVKGDTRRALTIPQDQVINTREPRKVISGLTWESVDLGSDGIVSSDKKVLDDGIISCLKQLWEMRLDVERLVSKEI